MWKPNDRLRHRFNRDLGPGRVVAVEGRTVVVSFAAAGSVLRLSATDDALVPVELRPGRAARVEPGGRRVVLETLLEDGRWRLADGSEVAADSLSPIDPGESPIERLAHGDVDPVEDFALRLDANHLGAVREADGLGSFLGGRIRLFPHQLHAAEKASRSDPVRWLLADEVGLGKTVEACLVLHRLVRTGRAERVLVVAPETLTVQWLGELWRKYHEVFVLLDETRLRDVARDYGAGFNPFDAHRRVVVGLETLSARPDLTRHAVEAGIDLLIVDEAHHLRRPAGHPGTEAYRAVEPIAALGRHVLLLTAVPLEDDAHGYFRLLQLLRPEEFPAHTIFRERLENGAPLPPCTSATRRADIGGLPPRVSRRIEIGPPSRWDSMRELERIARSLPADNPAQRRSKVRRVARALASGAALAAAVGSDEAPLRAAARKAAREDPRVDWLVEQGRLWRDAGDKTLVFVAERACLEHLRTELSRRGQLRTGVFHEDLSPAQRDIEVAQFRIESGPSMMISTECGGEGRNFEFCRRIVLFDLPWNPATVEQRIGRLDRIGRDRDVEIRYVRPPDGLGAAVADLFESIGLFREPLGGLDRELRHVARAVEEVAAGPPGPLAPDLFAGVVAEAAAARDRVREAAYHELHREPYRPEMARAILSRVPEDLDALTEEVVVAACERFGLGVERQRGERAWSIEFGNQAVVDHLPGVAAGSSYLGTFDREAAVADEGLDFFASGHPLVEGLLAHLEESPRGRTALLHVQADGEEGFGLLALYRSGAGLEAFAVDLEGRGRDDWAARLSERPLRTRRVRAESWTRAPGWSRTIRRLAESLPRTDEPEAVALFRIGP